MMLLYGPHGSGKTLAVHALAKHFGGIVAQIEGLSNLKIQYFVKEFARVATEYTMTKRPIFIFIKNIDSLVQNALPELLFLFDKFCNDNRNIELIASSSIPAQYLPKQMKFTYIQCINCANQRSKYDLFKFLTAKFGMNIQMEEQDLMNFVYHNFRNYSNNDVFQVLKLTLEKKKQSEGNLSEIDRNTLEYALTNTRGSLSQQVIQFYNL